MPDDFRSPPPETPAPPVRRQLVSSGVLGMLIFIAVELMFFAGLISAFMIVKNSALPGAWPPPNQPRLPVEATAVNTAALLASGALVWLASSAFAKSAARARTLLTWGTVLGAFFVAAQGVEWVRLIGQGLTLQASTYGSFFYLIVGAHGLHAVAALGALAWCWRRLGGGRLRRSELSTVLALWTFVVGVWPVLYLTVYVL